MDDRTLQAPPEDYIEKNDVETSRFKKKQYIVASVIWCVAGWVNAAITWHVLWLPGLLIFIPGVFVACIIAAIFFIPLSGVMKKIRTRWESDQPKNWNLMLAATVLKVFLYLGPLIGSIFYVHILRVIIE